MLRWYYTAAAATQADYFVLPPSGWLYSYPSLFAPADQAAYVAATEAAALLLNTSATVEWEVAFTWSLAISDYVPRYAAKGIVRALFAVNVPFMVPVFEFGADQFFLSLPSNATATPAYLFRPNEWRGTSGGVLPPPFMSNATEFAGIINAYPPGTRTHIYATSDGGFQLSDFDDLVAGLAEHVQVVSPDTLVDLLGQRAAQQQ